MSKSEENLKNQGIIIFVEGETDKVFFEKLINYLCKKNDEKIPKKIIIENIKGIGRYKEAHRIFEKKIKPKYEDIDFDAICSYDTDVFEFNRNPPINWREVEENLKAVGIKNVVHIKAKSSIEDWFLLDFDGLCRYLKYKNPPKKVQGNTGHDKIKALFKKQNKIYQKGHYVHKFMDDLNFELICEKLKEEVSKIKKLIF